MGTIVVGVDGSDASRRALRWAVDEARLRRASVEAVHVQDETVPVVAAGAGPAGAAPVPPAVMDDVMREAEDRAWQLVRRMVAELGTADDVPVEPVVLSYAGPAAALVERADGAELLVVGSRGLGGFKEVLLGSVSHQCASEAPCPVVILREQDEPR